MVLTLSVRSLLSIVNKVKDLSTVADRICPMGIRQNLDPDYYDALKKLPRGWGICAYGTGPPRSERPQPQISIALNYESIGVENRVGLNADILDP